MKMKKYILLFFAAALTLSVFAFATNESPKEDVKVQEYDSQIETLKMEIKELNKTGKQRATVLDSLLNTI
ncbi:MAG: hypothetical protein HKN75_07045 [Bacteroidia bacterium]|nr:hypothetical protein [Bacteroidia bacterium]